ncbi:FCD domain-containing protein [Desulfofundulus thermobenzoicus]|uniref:FCD domain-containing protein n=1 Tax=Desulfofundulus thermobenzoicus TaxID=29376 RepID=A0A6N7IX93_9FIRM|nr:FCD domain-containing protein [Desulfofundulus thermobenzoicus]
MRVGGEILTPVEPYQGPDTREMVYIKLKKALLAGEIGSGQRLVERKLAEKLGVSRTPVREAIRMLEREGLVRHVPRSGSVAVALSPGEVLDIYSIRAVLEGLAARLAAERIDEPNIRQMEEKVRQMDWCIQGGQTDRLENLHLEFNDLIYRSAGSPRLYRMITSLVDYVAGFTRTGYTHPGRMEEAAAEHRQLARAIAMRDGLLAERIAREHIENSRRAFFARAFNGEKNR